MKYIQMLLLMYILMQLMVPISGSITNNTHFNTNTISREWNEGESLTIIFVRDTRIIPYKFEIDPNQVLSGTTASLFSDDNDKLTFICGDEYTKVIIYMKARNSGKFYTFANINDTTLYFNVSVLNPVTGSFDLLGTTNGTSYYIDKKYLVNGEEYIFLIHENYDFPPVGNFVGRISHAYIIQDQEQQVISTEYKHIDSHTILHKMELNIYDSNVKIQILNISRWWRFEYSEPEVEWNFTEKSFYVKYPGTYRLYFSSQDYWRYPGDQESRIVIFNTRGKYLPFDSFNIEYRYIRRYLNESAAKNTYLFCRNITVYNPNNEMALGLPIRIELNRTNFDFWAVNEDFSDIYFTQEIDGEIYELPYYLEHWDHESAVIWVKLKSVMPESNATIKMYYGRENAISRSDSSAKIPYYFGDEFNKPLNSDKWTWDSGWYTSDGALQHDIEPTKRQILSNEEMYDKSKIVSLMSQEVSIGYSGIIFLYANDSFYYRAIVNETEFLKCKAIYQKIVNGTVVSEITDTFSSYPGLWSIEIKVFRENNTINIYFGGFQHIIIDNELPERWKVGFLAYNKTVSVSHIRVSKILNKPLELISIGQEEVNEDPSIFIYLPTEYRQLFYPYLSIPAEASVNIIVRDVFGNILSNKTYPPQDLYVILLEVYSLKFKNNRDDSFVHIRISRYGASFVWSEWIAPGEIVNYLLSPGSYKLELSYQSGGYIEIDNFTLSEDMFFMLNGTVLGDVLDQIAATNSSIINHITRINLYISTVNTTLYNQSIELNLNINNMNTTLSNLFLKLNSNVSILQTTLENISVEITSQIESVNSLIRALNISIENLLNTTNSSINSILLDINNRLAVIETNLDTIMVNITNQNELINTSILKYLQMLQENIIGFNSSINSILLNISSNLLLLNTTVGLLTFNLSNNMLVLNTTISKITTTILQSLELVNMTLVALIGEVKTNLLLNNATINEFMWNITSAIITLNTTLGLIKIDLDDKIISINTTMNTLMADIDNNLFLVNTQINQLNETVLVTLMDLKMNISKSFWMTWEDLNDISEFLPTYISAFRIDLFNAYTGESVPISDFKVLVNGTLVDNHIIYTLADAVNISVLDYWDRVIWSNVTREKYIKVYLYIGNLIIINERSDTVEVHISPQNGNKNLTIIMPPYSTYRLQIPIFGAYNITVISGEAVISTGVFKFESTKEEPKIILKLTHKGIVFDRNIAYDSIIIGAVAGFSSALGVFAALKWIANRRGILRVEDYIKKILEEEQQTKND